MQRSNLRVGVVAGAVLLMLLASQASAQLRAFGRPMMRVRASGNLAAVDRAGAQLHLAGDPTATGFPINLTDGGGFLWDIYYHGYVNRGTNYVFSSAYPMNFTFNNSSSSFQWNSGSCIKSKDGNEIEMGPCQFGGLQVSRRIRVYKDLPLARWIDIFHNTSDQAMTVQVQLYLSLNYGIASSATENGKAAFGDKDIAFLTTTQGGNNQPALMQVLCDAKSKVRPAVRVDGSCIYISYSVTIPARSTIALSYFSSQNKSLDDHKKVLKSLRFNKLFSDIPGSVRKLIVNFHLGGGLSQIALDRNDGSDSLALSNGDPLLGTVQNKSFTIDTIFGRTEFPAEQIVGMVMGLNQEEGVRTVLTDGQVIAGKVLEKELVFQTTGGVLHIPLSKVRTWSYRVSREKPDDISPKGPYFILRTGDLLNYDPKRLPMAFVTRHGKLKLASDELMEIRFENSANGVDRLVFRNGSSLGGFFQDDTIRVPLTLAKPISISRDMVQCISFNQSEAGDASLAVVSLSNGDELRAKLAKEALKLDTEFGLATISPDNIKSICFEESNSTRAIVTLWDDSVLRGRFLQKQVLFHLTDTLDLPVSLQLLSSLTSSNALPPSELVRRVDKLVALLGAESYLDRVRASDELKKMGATIAGALERHLKDRDPEVRYRIQAILNAFENKPADTPRTVAID